MPQTNIVRFTLRWAGIVLTSFAVIFLLMYMSAEKSVTEQNKDILTVREHMPSDFRLDGWKAHPHKEGMLVQYDQTALWYVKDKTVICLSPKAKNLTPGLPYLPNQVPQLKENSAQ
ncbi:MAG: hypothetical protein KC649_00210 [Candidatus Omnitrophica bacterium]|nr:hypothetical protein [Candidatus Omnitrophota bacterium]